MVLFLTVLFLVLAVWLWLFWLHYKESMRMSAESHVRRSEELLRMESKIDILRNEQNELILRMEAHEKRAVDSASERIAIDEAANEIQKSMAVALAAIQQSVTERNEAFNSRLVALETENKPIPEPKPKDANTPRRAASWAVQAQRASEGEFANA